MTRLRALVFVISAFGAVLPAWAADLTLIVDRRESSVALYLKLPAADLSSVFGTGADALLGEDGTVDVPRLYEGTYLLADDIFAGSRVTVGGQDTRFEALSMMVHDPDVLPDFAMPYDGEMSIAICTSPETVDDMGLETLEAYLGFFAWKVDGRAAITIDLPATGRDSREVRVLEFVDQRPVADLTQSLPDGGQIDLTAKSPARGSALGWMVAASVGLLALALVLLFPGLGRRRLGRI